MNKKALPWRAWRPCNPFYSSWWLKCILQCLNVMPIMSYFWKHWAKSFLFHIILLNIGIGMLMWSTVSSLCNATKRFGVLCTSTSSSCGGLMAPLWHIFPYSGKFHLRELLYLGYLSLENTGQELPCTWRMFLIILPSLWGSWCLESPLLNSILHEISNNILQLGSLVRK